MVIMSMNTLYNKLSRFSEIASGPAKAAMLCVVHDLSWCERGDSNPHGLPRWNLNPAQ